MFMITVHEFGHYTAGKIFKFKIYEFSIGFGKAIFKKTKKNGEVFAIRVVPLGGYCAFGEDEEADDDPHSFNNQAWWKRAIVLASGAIFNFISAILFCVVLLAVIGSGQSKITSVSAGNTNDIRVGDIVTHVDGVKCSFFHGTFGSMTQGVEDDTTPIVLTIIRSQDGKSKTMNVTVYKHLAEVTDENGNSVMKDGAPVTEYQIGVTSALHNYSFGKALLKAVPFAFEIAWECLVILGKLLVGKYGLKDLGGPVTTISTIASASSQSMLNLLLYIPLIAVNLAVFNLLPIPALDGARIVFVLIEAIRRKPVNKDIEAKIHAVGIIVLLAFVVLVDFLQLVVF